MIFKKGDIVQFTHGSSHRETAKGIGVVLKIGVMLCMKDHNRQYY